MSLTISLLMSFYCNWKYMIDMLLYGYFHITPNINLRHPY